MPLNNDLTKVDQFRRGVKVDWPKCFSTYPSFEHDTRTRDFSMFGCKHDFGQC